MKNKKVFIIVIVIICLATLLGGSAKTSKYYGVYVCASDTSRSVELVEFSIPKRKGKANLKNAALPRLGIKSLTAKNITFEVNKKTGRVLAFVTFIEGKEVSGTLNLDTATVNIEGCTYIKV